MRGTAVSVLVESSSELAQCRSLRETPAYGFHFVWCIDILRGAICADRAIFMCHNNLRYFQKSASQLCSVKSLLCIC